MRIRIIKEIDQNERYGWLSVGNEYNVVKEFILGSVLVLDDYANTVKVFSDEYEVVDYES